MSGKKNEKENAMVNDDVDYIVSKFKDNFFTVDSFKDIPVEFIPFFPTYDALTHGGIRNGQTVEISGPTGVGKTTAALELLASGEKMGYNTYYEDVENRLEGELLTICGNRNLHIIASTKKKLLTGDDYLEALEDIIYKTDRSMIVVDSVAALISLDSKKMANIATKMTDLLKKSASTIRVKGHILILMNHLKQKFNVGGKGSSYMPPVFYTPGGEYIQFQSSTVLQLWKGELVRPKASSEEKGEGDQKETKDDAICSATGHVIKFRIKKAPKTRPYTLEIPLIYGKGLDLDNNCMELAMAIGKVEASGSWLTYQDFKIQGKDNFVNGMKEAGKWNEFYEEVRKAVL